MYITSILAFLLPMAIAAPMPDAETGNKLIQRAASNLHAGMSSKGRYMGTCADPNTINISQNQAILKSDFGWLTPENSMKWDALQPAEGTWNWANADAFVNFATSNGKKIRGHTLVWHSQLPSWVSSITDKTRLQQVIEKHIATVMARYKGKIAHWDVVNEMWEDSGSPRQSVFYKVLGYDFVRIAFAAARNADSAAKLYINDYSLEYQSAKRTAMVNNVKAWKTAGVPIDGIGSQCHMNAGLPTNFQTHLSDLASTGADVAITEIDIAGAASADYTGAVKACLNVAKCVGITVWGVSDANSWRASVNPLLWDTEFPSCRTLLLPLSETPSLTFAFADLYHGEPFRGPGAAGTSLSWWGGFCQHATVLFPTWHRAYVLRLENALRSIPGCEDVVMPFWDECLAVEGNQGNCNPSNVPVIPLVLTQKTFPLDGTGIPNPLYSYTFAKEIVDNASDGDYNKRQGYETKRYPLSGLDGPQDQIQTADHNNNYPDATRNTEILNENVKAWLEGSVKITTDPTDPKKEVTRYPDTFSVHNRFKRCLEAPNYNIFSNTASQAYWIDQAGHTGDADYYDFLESPHNAIHLAVGGFYSAGTYDADAILGANGDMGENDTAAFDPIFFFHHCFIDHVFWLWQVKNGHTGGFEIIEDYNDPGLISDGVAGVAQGDVLTLDTRLWPFEYNSRQVFDIYKLGYEYGPSSLTPYSIPAEKGGLKAPEINKDLYGMIKVSGVTKDTISGSFVIDTWAIRGTGTTTKNVLIHSEPVLSRWGVQGCLNCQNHLDLKVFVPVHKDVLDGEPEEWTFRSKVRDRVSSNLKVASPQLALHPRGGKQILKIVQ